jgi:hypothetical protein
VHERGLLVRSVTRREAEWDEGQQGWMLALAMYRQLTCDGCGGWLPETTRHPAEEYEVPAPYRCGACTALQIRQRIHAESIGTEHGDGQMSATRWTVERRQHDGNPHRHGRASGQGHRLPGWDEGGDGLHL